MQDVPHASFTRSEKAPSPTEAQEERVCTSDLLGRV